MPVMVLQPSRLLLVRVAALVLTCVTFSMAAHGAQLLGTMSDWCMFCWVFSFLGMLFVLVVELLGLQARMPVSWNNFPITLECYAALLCLSTSIIFPLYFLKDKSIPREPRDYRIASSVFSCLATVAYLVEVSLARSRSGEVAGYMATVPGLLKVCETFVASMIFVFVSEPVSYDRHPALKWCMAVYCICFVISAAVVVICVGECTGRLPFPFDRFKSAYALLATVMYLTATIIWPVFQFDQNHGSQSRRPSYCQNAGGLCPWDKLVVVTILTALNFLIYVADLVYSARLVFVRM